MKKFFFFLVFTLSIFNFLKAQDQDQPAEAERKMPTPKEIGDRETQRMKKELILTDTQAVQINVINIKYAEQQIALFQEARAANDFASLRNKMDGIMMAKSFETKPILTEEQLKKYEKYKKKIQREMEGGGAPPQNMRRQSGMRGQGGMQRPGGGY